MEYEIKKIDVSIIIVNYNTVKFVINAIDSVIQHTQDILYEIIIVDNNSSDNSEKLLNEIYSDKIKYISLPENIGFGRANNEGIRISNGRNILFLNPDTKLINNAVKILSDHLDENSKTGICGGNLLDEDMQPTISYEMIFPSIFYEIDKYLGNLLTKLIYGKHSKYNFSENVKTVAYISGADLMIRKNLLDSVGGYNLHFFMYYEETELCFRVKKAGFKIKNVPSAKIQHLEGKSFDQTKINTKKLRIQEESRGIFYDLCYSKFYKNIASSVRNILILFRFVLSIFINRDSHNYWSTMVKIAILKK